MICEELRTQLVTYIRTKFYSIADISYCADDIVNEACQALLSSDKYSPDKENFGYLSVTCVRIAYRLFLRMGAQCNTISLHDYSDIIPCDDFVDEVMRDEDIRAILASFEVLRAIERIVITERYFDGCTFAEIAKKYNLKLNTVLSHHRRALEKLRPRLLGYFRDEYPEWKGE